MKLTAGFIGRNAKYYLLTCDYVLQLRPDEGKREENRTWEVMTGGVGGSGNNGPREETGHLQKQPTKCCSSSASCMSTETVMGNWLALATANSASDESSQD